MAFILAGVFLVSFSLLSFEISLTRILSVLLSYHYVFLAISLALMGLGLGGMVIHFSRSRISNTDNSLKFLSYLASLSALLIAASPPLMIAISQSERLQNNILIFGLVLVLPFLVAGMILAEVFRVFPDMSARLYGADLAGAAVSAVGAVLALNAFGGTTAIVFLAVTASTAAVLFAFAVRGVKGATVPISLGVMLCALLLFGVSRTSRLPLRLAVGSNPAKEIHDVLSRPEHKGKIIETRWSAFGRTDLVEFEGYPDQMEIYLDGTAGTPMYRFSGKIDDPDSVVANLKSSFSGSFPFFFLKENERDNALVIGPGGGRDILVMLLAGVKRITAVEVNKDLVDIVRKYSWYNGAIYTRSENVEIIVDDGRNFLKRQRGQYDLIMLSLPVTASSRSLEGFALTENYLFTTDSLKDYLRHLTDEGQLVVVCHGDVEISRLVTLSLSALKDMEIGPTEAMKRIFILGSEKYPVFVLRKTPFEPERVSAMVGSLGRFGVRADESYFPYIRTEETRRSILMALGDGKLSPQDFEKKIEELGYDVSPVADNNPFFYKIEPGMPKSVSKVLWISALLVGLALIVPILFRIKMIAAFQQSYRFAVLFAMLGVGFMLVEISLIQRFVLFLGQPVLSMSIILFSILAGAAAGSLASGRIVSGHLRKKLSRASLSVLTVVLIYAIALPFILERILGLSLSLRLMAAGVLLAPLGFFMGLPFPLALRALRDIKAGHLIPWMWGLNGACSVLGSAAAIAISIRLGFSQAFLAGGFCYLVVFLFFLRSRPLRA